MATNLARSYGLQVVSQIYCLTHLLGLCFCLLWRPTINPSKKKTPNVEVVAEFIIKITGPTRFRSDVDLWMRDPRELCRI